MMHDMMMPRLLLLFLCISLLACQGKKETISPARESITESVYASGILKSKSQYQVYSTVSGILQEVFVDEGDTVKRGMPLCIVVNDISTLNRENAQLAAKLADFSANQSRLDELELNIQVAKSRMLNDSLLLERQQYLWSQQIGSKVELEKMALAYEQSKAQYTSARLRHADEKRRLMLLSEQARKNLQISRKNENDYTITSMVDGVIYSLEKNKGELVSPQTPIAIIGDADEFILELEVDEYDITSIRVGQEVKVTMDSYKGELFDAVVTKINPIMNDRTRTITVEATFIDPPPALYPNLTLEANIILQVKENALTLPREFIINDKAVINSHGDTIDVKLGLKDYQKVEILEGIDESVVVIHPAE